MCSNNRSRISLKSGPKAFDHCKTPAGTDQFELENPSENGVVSASSFGLEGVSCGARSLAAGKGYETQPCCAGATKTDKSARCASSGRVMQQVVENPPLSIEDSSQNRAVPFPLVLLPKSALFVAGEAALELRN